MENDANSSNGLKKPETACEVCNDKATGVHYGLTTCEGCKGIFDVFTFNFIIETFFFFCRFF